MEKSAAATLPEDVLLEILARVTDPVALFRCATACNRWRDLVVEPSFLNRRWPENSPDRSLLLGFFVQLRNVGTGIAGTTLPDPARAFRPAPTSPLGGPPNRFLASHFPVVLDGGGDFSDHVMVPLASRHGLLLVRLLPPRGTAADPVQLAVYNMFVGSAYDVLPPLECHGFSYILCSAVVTSADIQQQQSLPPFFKVIIIGMDKRRYNLYSFSSCEASWRAPIQCRSFPPQGVHDMTMPRASVVCQGRVHWLFVDFYHFYILSVSVDTHQVSLMKVHGTCDPPNTYASSRLCVGTDGRLALLALSVCTQSLQIESLQLEIWTQEKDGPELLEDTTRWLCSQVIDIEKPKQSQITTVIWMYLGERIGTSLMLANYSGTFLVDLETRTTNEQVTGQFSSIDYMDSVPFEMDWPTFFASRLGKLSRSRQN